MAADPNVGDLYQVTLSQSLLGQRLLNTLHFRLESLAGAFPNLASFMTDVYAKLSAGGQLVPTFQAMLPTNCFHDRTWIQRLAPTRAAKGVFGISINGTGLGTAEASNMQFSITRQDDLALKNSTGAMHVVVPPIPTTVIIANGWAAAQTAKANALAALMVGTFTTASGYICRWVLLHKHPKPALPTFSYIAVTTPQPTVRVMRRRTLGVGK